MARRFTIDDVKAKLKERGNYIIYIDGVYKNADSILNFQCNNCKSIFSSTYDKVMYSKGCNECRYDRMTNTIDKVQKDIHSRNENITILEYKGRNYPMKCYCEKHCCEFKTKYGNHRTEDSSCGCPECHKEMLSESRMGTEAHNKYTINDITSMLLELNDNIEVISNEYINSKIPIKFRCKLCEREWATSWDIIKQKPTCSVCEGTKHERISDVQKILSSKNENLLITSEEYVNNSTDITVKCLVCDYTWITKWRAICSNPKCQSCIHNEKSLQKDLIDWARDNIKQWKLDSMEACDYKCVISKQRFNDIHHIFNISDILIESLSNLNLERKTIGEYTYDEVNNIKNEINRLHYIYGLGVCLTREFHDEFHREYGYRNNTINQFKEYYRNKTGKEFDIKLKK